ncbi:uncharacterized protein LOC130939533 [Arachis stenosperma]|uniref:uncharacterized protein LOC130939533 n=1 Tax=Arachis stenosperma TaxID=217475 RepID=UPI0025AD927C|nr:uncharacterized protein LOC130939533 [Arachis stenosperma]
MAALTATAPSSDYPTAVASFSSDGLSFDGDNSRRQGRSSATVTTVLAQTPRMAMSLRGSPLSPSQLLSTIAQLVTMRTNSMGDRFGGDQLAMAPSLSSPAFFFSLPSPSIPVSLFPFLSMQANGKSLKEFNNMPYPSDEVIDGLDDHFIMDELNFDWISLKLKLQRCLQTITDEQQNAFDKILNVVNSGVGGYFFMYGYGGTRKTFLWRTLSATFRSSGQTVLNIAFNCITAHFRFKIPLSINEDYACHIKQRSSLARLVCKVKLIIWDKAPMLKKYCFEALYKCFKDILCNESYFNPNLPFGGKVAILGGDSRQILHVIPMSSYQNIVQSSINSSYLWPSCKVIRLKRNIRLTEGGSLPEDEKLKCFVQWLIIKIGEGLGGNSTNGEFEVIIPEKILIDNNTNSFEKLVSFVYLDLLLNINNSIYFKERTILVPTLQVVPDVNNIMMGYLTGEEKVYISSDSLCIEEGNMESELDIITTVVWNSINYFELPTHQFKLKVGVPIMLLRNIDQSKGL